MVPLVACCGCRPPNTFLKSIRTIPRKKRNNTEDRRAFIVAAAQLCGADDMLAPYWIYNQGELSINPHKLPFRL